MAKAEGKVSFMALDPEQAPHSEDPPKKRDAYPDSTTDTGFDTDDTRRTFAARRSMRQSIGAYTSLFPRKLLPPLGFYREVDKYSQLKVKFKDNIEKLDALEEMWTDYKKYQIRKRFRWPPLHIFFRNFFWTTGYYADYQKAHRATTLRKPGEDSSEEEFFDPMGQYMIAGQDGDINLDEFERYRQAKLFDPNRDKRYTRWDIKPLGKKNETEQIETVVEYALIPNPNKRKSEAGKKGRKSLAEAVKEAEAEGGQLPPVIGKRKSVVVKKIVTDKATGEKTEKVEQNKEEVDFPDLASDFSVDPVKVKRKSRKSLKKIVIADDISEAASEVQTSAAGSKKPKATNAKTKKGKDATDTASVSVSESMKQKPRKSLKKAKDVGDSASEIGASEPTTATQKPRKSLKKAKGEEA